MRRLLLYSAAILVAAVAAFFAWTLPEARLGFVALGLAMVAGLLWAVQKFPRVQKAHLFGAAGFSLLLGLLFATALPSTRVPCDCPQPIGSVGGYDCSCPWDRHMALRIEIASAGAVGAGLLLVGARRSSERSAPS